VSGVNKIQKLEEVAKIDLIIWSHVMEHVAQPYDELKKLLEHSRYVYVEVPFGVPKSTAMRRSFIFQIIGLLISLSSTLYAKFSSPAAGRVSARSLIKESEHLSFYDEDTFPIIAKKLGAHLNYKVDTSPTPEGSEAHVIRALFQPSNENFGSSIIFELSKFVASV
jgi:hypothetical protein